MKKQREATMKNTPSVDEDGIDRRGFLECMRWAGAGLLWTFSAGVPVQHVGCGYPAPDKCGGFLFRADKR